MTQRNITILGASIFAMMMVACTPKQDVKPASSTDETKPAATAANDDKPLTLVFGTDATYAPFEMTDASGKIVGFDIDIANAMCAEMKAKCSFVNQEFEGIIPGLIAKKYDGIVSSLSVTDERKKAVLFTQKIWDAPNRFIAKEGSTIKVADGLKGSTLGVQAGTIQETYAKKHFPDAKIKSYKTIENAYTDLTSKRVDAVFGDGVVISDFLKSPAAKGYAQLGEDVPNSADPAILGAGTAFAVRLQDKDLVDKLNRAFDAIRANGKYKEINNKYFAFDIYGGGGK